MLKDLSCAAGDEMLQCRFATDTLALGTLQPNESVQNQLSSCTWNNSLPKTPCFSMQIHASSLRCFSFSCCQQQEAVPAFQETKERNFTGEEWQCWLLVMQWFWRAPNLSKHHFWLEGDSSQPVSHRGYPAPWDQCAHPLMQGLTL